MSEQFAQELIAFNKQVGEEDDTLTNSVQRGLIGGLPDRGRFLTNSENLPVHFQKLVVNALSKAPAAAKQAVEAQAAVPRASMISVNEADSLIPQSERNAYFPVEIAKVEQESDTIRSFYLRRADGAPLSAWEPGQFLPIRLNIPGQPTPVLRTYTLSTCANPDYYRLSIRRIDDGLVSRFLHESAKAGLKIEAMAPRGKFVLDQSSLRPIALLSGGVGLTPMMAMLEHLASSGKRSGKFRPVYFIHGTQNGRAHAFAKRVKQLAAEYPGLTVHFCYSEPVAERSSRRDARLKRMGFGGPA